KKRPAINPLICHISDVSMAKKHAYFDLISLNLSKVFWPGPLTLLLTLLPQSDIHPLTTSYLKTACFRMPCGFSRKLISTYGYPLAIPSANISGEISATSTESILSSPIGKKIPLILDGGPSEIGLESTIVKVEDNNTISILRPGGLETETIKIVAGKKLGYPMNETSTLQAPGMLKSHYAPRATVRLEATHANPREALIRFANFPVKNIKQAIISLDLSPSGDLKEAAYNLFNYLKIADTSGANSIAFTPIPRHGLGEAINDRLKRAAAPRN
ncbi:L-threonylcarbamoyladenylate synthase, partial [Candidatus Liberibacter sp.]|uniref:L-threonylcarbamoyladenylate synthase n=1 Tax=Candidatus Liberibacter sp. TaxID=34022 RepID=UPI0015F5A122